MRKPRAITEDALDDLTYDVQEAFKKTTGVRPDATWLNDKLTEMLKDLSVSITAASAQES